VAYAVGLDFLMNPAYMSVLAIGVIWSGRRLPFSRARRMAAALAWLAWSVVLTNVAENVGLFLALTSGSVDPWSLVVAGAHYWAGLIIAGCLAFVGAGLLLGARSPAERGAAADRRVPSSDRARWSPASKSGEGDLVDTGGSNG
jgi:hypothetical protein